MKNQTIAVYDIETPFITKDGVGAIPNIYCIAVALIVNGIASPAKLYTEYWTPYSDGSLMQAITLMNSAGIVCAHNGIGFDDLVLKNILRVDIGTTYDTLILSKIVFSKDELFAIDATLDIPKDLWGSYSLKAFGYRLGNFKIQFEDFDNGLTEQLGIYCKQDVDLTVNLILFLQEKESFPLETVIEIEHQAAAIITEQTVFGFYIDIEKTRKLNTKLLTEKLELATELSAIFSPKFLRDGKVKSYKKLSKIKKYLPNTAYIPLIGTKL